MPNNIINTAEDEKLPPNNAAVVIFLDEETGKVLVHDRSQTSKSGECIGFIGGGIEPEETPEQAAIREVEEELNFTLKEDDLKKLGTYTSDVNNQTGQIEVFVAQFPGFEQIGSGHKGGNFELASLEELRTKNIFPIMHKLMDDLKNKHI